MSNLENSVKLSPNAEEKLPKGIFDNSPRTRRSFARSAERRRKEESARRRSAVRRKAAANY